MNIYSLFYRSTKPDGIEKRKDHIVGGGIAGLTASTFLIDDAAGMPGENITIYEKRRDMGGCYAVIGNEGAYVCRSERESSNPTWSACGICAVRFRHWTLRNVRYWMRQWTQTGIRHPLGMPLHHGAGAYLRIC